jgi:CRISPR system Cascade subunit CasD
MKLLILRLCGPLMSLAGPSVDAFPMSLPIPSASMLAGLLGAALGYRRGDPRLQELAKGLDYAVVVHRPGVPIIDFQTANLDNIGDRIVSTDIEGFLVEVARSTTSSRAMARRPFLSDADMRVVVRLPEGWEADAVLAALRDPVFPLFLGRTHCMPSEDIGEAVVEAESIESALAALPEGTRYLPVAGFDPLSVEVPPRGAPLRRFAVA